VHARRARESGTRLPARLAPPIAPSAATASTAAGTSTSTAAAKTVATASTAATGTRFAWPRLIHGQRPSTHIGAIERRHGLVGLGIVRHLYECETTGLPRVTIFYDLYPIHLTICGERGIKILLGSLERDVPDVNILQSSNSLFFCCQLRGIRRCLSLAG
jgi:hypothetical protein